MLNINTSSIKRYDIAIVAPTPFYYHVPLYRLLALSPEINLTIYYCSDETLHGIEIKKTYLSKGKIVEDDLLNGYNYKFLKNYSLIPSFLHWPFGLINIGIWKEIKEGKYDAIVFQSWTNLTWWLAFFACLKFRVPIFFMTDSNIYSESLKNEWKIFFKKIIFNNFLFKKATGFLTSGTANEKFYSFYGVPEKKMIRLPFSWGYEKFILEARKLESKREEIRASFNIRKEDFVLLFVGRLSREKNLFNLLKAYNSVARPQRRLIIVGDGPLRSSLERYINRLKIKNIFLAGFQSQNRLYNFYTIADALVLPSGSETWGIVINEAMCFSLPIIVSDNVGSAVDLIRDGYNGFLFAKDNVKQFAYCIEHLASMSFIERKVFGRRSLEIITKWIKDSDPVPKIGRILKLIENKP